MSQEALDAQDVDYGNLRKPALPGIGRLTFGQAVGMAVASGLLILLIMFGQIWLALGWLLFVCVAAIPLFLPSRSGQNIYQRATRAVVFKRAEKKGTTRLRQGVVGRTPDGKTRLPGLGASMILSEHEDAYGVRFGMISLEKTHHHTVVIECHAAGTSGVDQSTINNQVAHWGGWLSLLGQSGDIVGASVVVETAPDYGHRLTAAATRGVVKDAPDFAVQVLDDVLDSYPSGSPAITTKIAVTFTGKPKVDGGGGKALTIEEMAEEIGTRLPQLIGSLGATGAGTTARACHAQEIIDSTRVAFDPSVASEVEEARLGEGTGLEWSDAGPVAADNCYEHFAHESACSVSFQMVSPPRGVFYAQTLEPLLRPSRHIARKRVAILYRPESPESAAQAVERDINFASFKATQKGRATQRDIDDLAAARQTSREESRGASLVRFGIIVTATVMDEEDLVLARKTITSQLAPKLKWRPARGSQDVAFLASMPLGLILPEHMAIPSSIRDSL